MLKRPAQALTLALVSCVAFAHMGARAAEPAGLKEQAVARLAASHDPAIFIAVGRVYVKQAGLLEAHRLLAERGRAAGLGADWSPRAVAWMDAQAQLTALIDVTIARRIEDPAWFRTAWGAVAATVLSAEEADEIATHFSSEGGAQQRTAQPTGGPDPRPAQGLLHHGPASPVPECRTTLHVPPSFSPATHQAS